MRFPRIHTLIVPVLLIAPAAFAVEGNQEDLVFFEKHIRPILVQHCYECHSEEAGKRKGGLWLDRRAGWQHGGDTGPAIVPGNPDASLFIEAVRYGDPDFEMPPEEKLSPDQIAHLEEWVRRGAFDPRDADGVEVAESKIDVEAGREFWSFQPIEKPELPAVENADWARTDIDRFILSRLESENLTPAPRADRETLLRRVTLTLTGLPPTIDEQNAFLSDESPDAFEKVVDRLLNSDAFAERWARHWLDIMRYADTSGGGRAMALPDAWRFRDFVIDSFRKDKPLDELIREHIAGDLLPHSSREEQIEHLTATGFLVLGPHNYENQDKELLDLEIVDEQIDTIGKAFLGMTIGCARCHDHKFDPIPTKDYYAMAGIFLSTKSVNHSNVSRWYTDTVPPTPKQEAELAAFQQKLKPLEKEIAELKKEIKELGGKTDGGKRSVAINSLPGVVVDNENAELVGEWMISTSSPMWVGANYAHDSASGKGEKSATFRPDIPETGNYEVRISWSSGTNRTPRLPVEITHFEDTTKVEVDQSKEPTTDGVFESLGTFRFAQGNDGFVRIDTAGTSQHVIIDAVQFIPEGQNAKPAKPAEPKTNPDKQLIADLKKDLKTREDELKKLKSKKPELPTVMCTTDAETPEDTPVRVRGLPRNFGETAPRGFLQVAMRPDATAPKIEGGSGRLELANWIASEENPLTARVLANRIWQHLVGQGIVRTPDNFGTTGTLPTHPELLDFLAVRLVENDWSAKKLIHEIVISQTWQMASDDADPRGAEVDPENELLYRAHKRRIDAEVLRDSILALSGTLDPEKGGPSLPSGFRSEFGYEFKSKKRSIYIPVFRNQLHEIFKNFDFANPNFVVGKRSESTIPTQSLYLMNSDFIHEQAKAAADRLLSENPETTEAGVRLAYRRILCREPNPDELALSLEFLQSQEKSSEAWAGLIRTLYSCVDFQYIQ